MSPAALKPQQRLAQYRQRDAGARGEMQQPARRGWGGNGHERGMLSNGEHRPATLVGDAECRDAAENWSWVRGRDVELDETKGKRRTDVEADVSQSASQPTARGWWFWRQVVEAGRRWAVQGTKRTAQIRHKRASGARARLSAYSIQHTGTSMYLHLHLPQRSSSLTVPILGDDGPTAPSQGSFGPRPASSWIEVDP
jgi:hypothetical protein